MNLSIKLLCYLMLLLCVFSCSSTKKQDVQNYKNLDHYTMNSKSDAKTLIVPPDLTGLKTKNKYSFPNGSVRASEMKNKNNNKKGILSDYNNIHIENDGIQKYLVIEDINAEKIWNDLKYFWVDMGFSIDKEEPQIGFMETKWAESRTNIPQDPIRRLFEKIGLGNVYSSSVMDKFIIRLEKSNNKNYRVYFSHQAQEEVLIGRSKETSKWQPKAKDPNIEAQYLARFMLFLGADENVVDKNFKTIANNKIYLADIKNDTLILQGSLSRNKFRVSSALERMDFNINKYDDNQNIFYIKKANDLKFNKKRKIFGRKKNNINMNENNQEILVKLIPNNKDDNVIVKILNTYGNDYEDSKSIIERLYQELN